MNRKYSSLFVDLIHHNWILEILGNDIFHEMEKLGYKCSKGEHEDYNGEDISFHMWWVDAVPHKDAKLNVVFITHTDDKYKEKLLIRMKDQFDIFFCMSLEDAHFLIELGFEASKVFGINLPVRNTYIRPLTIGIFSKCYPDKRKNEDWLFRYCKNNPESKFADFVFIGDGWGNFVSQLSAIGCSFQWHNVSREMPCEYMYQQLKLANIDYYIYMGMDGGAMGSYDAYAMGTNLCISDDGYHKGIPDLEYSFDTEAAFNTQLDKIISKHVRKINFFKDNSVENYVKKINYILENQSYPPMSEERDYIYSIKEKRRSNYFDRGLVYGARLFISKMYKKWKFGK